MIAALVAALRPLYRPILKLPTAPPHLPEGSGKVEVQRPAEAYLRYRYLVACLTALSHLVPLTIALVVLSLTLGALGTGLGILGVVLSLTLLGFQLVVVRFDWELRHYAIGERSLRVREGAVVVREVTLSYANIQNVEVTQGPLERLFGVQSVRVTTAGGGGAMGPDGQLTGHGAVLVGLDRAEAIRGMLIERMRTHRGAGLGDPSEHPGAEPPRAELSAALAEVLEAARALRAAAAER